MTISRRNTRDISHERRAELNAGAPASHLTEMLVVDFAVLMQAAVPKAGRTAVATMQAEAGAGLTKRMALAGRLLYERLGPAGVEQLAAHSSDTVRGWACYLLAALPDLRLQQRLQRIRPLAADTHFGVREWAWMALRPAMAAELKHTVRQLQPWTTDTSEYLRRFASEALRPRGVWCAHIAALKANPAIGLPLLEPLQADASTYVQDSVANWLNDASKDQPDWVRNVCARWLKGTPASTTRRICKRALRTIGA